MYIEGQGDADSEADAGFDTAFAEFAKGSPPPEDEGRDQGEPPAEEPAPAGGDEPPAPNPGAAAPVDTSSDPWKDAPAALIAERDRLIAERDRAVHSDLSQRGRIAALQRKVVAPAPTPPAASPPQGNADGEAEREAGTSAGKSVLDEKIKQLREDYPDVAGPILELLEAQSAQLAGMSASVAAVNEERDAAAVAAQLSILEQTHPDWKTVGASPDFAGWLASQPEAIQKLAESYDARETGVALTMFKLERAEATQTAAPAAAATPTSDRRSRQMEGNRAVTSRTPPAASGAPADFEDAFAYFANQKAKK